MPKGKASVVAYAANGKKLAAVGAGGCYIWDFQKGQKPEKLANVGGKCLAFSPDGVLLAVGAGLFDGATGKMRTRLVKPGDIFAVAFSPDGKWLAIGGGRWGESGDTSIWLWNVAEGKTVFKLEGYTLPVGSLAFSPDGKTLASGGDDGTIRLWDVEKGKFIRQMDSAGHMIAYSPDGKVLASCGPQSDKILFFNPKTGEKTRSIESNGMSFSALAFSPDGKTLATAGDSCAIRLWETATGQEVLPGGIGHRGPVFTVAFSPDGKKLASRSSDSTISLWDVCSRKPLHTMRYGRWGGDMVCSLAFTPDSKQLLSLGGGVYSHDSVFHLWDTSSGERLAYLVGSRFALTSVAIAPDGDTVALASLSGVSLWSLSARKELRALDLQDLAYHSHQSHYDWCACFSPDGRTLAVSCGDARIRLFDWHSGGSAARNARREGNLLLPGLFS